LFDQSGNEFAIRCLACRLQPLRLLLEPRPFVRFDQSWKVAELLAQRPQDLLGVVASDDQEPLLKILLAQIDRLFEHPFDFLVRQAITWLDIDRMLAAGAPVPRADI